MGKRAHGGGRLSGAAPTGSKWSASSARRGIRRRARRAPRSLLLLFACLCLLPLVPQRPAGAQTVPEVVPTGYDITCGGTPYTLVLVSARAVLADENKTSVSSFGLALIPPKKASGYKIFNVYSLGAGADVVSKRDDDVGAFAFKDYDPNQVGTNLDNFFKSGAKCTAESIPTAVLAKMADAIRQNKLLPAAATFAQLVADANAGIFKNTNPLTQELPPLAPAVSGEDFSRKIREYITKIKLPASPGQEDNPSEDEVAELRRSVQQLAERAVTAEASLGIERLRAALLEAQRAKSRTLSEILYDYLWVILGVATLAVIAFIFRKRLLPSRDAKDADTSRAAAAFKAMLRDSRARFQALPQGHHYRYWDEIHNLLSDARKFQHEHHPKKEAGRRLTKLIKDAQDELNLSRNAPKPPVRPPAFYEDLFRRLIEYQEVFYPAAEHPGDGAHGASDDAEKQEREVQVSKEVPAIPEGASGPAADAQTNAEAPAQTTAQTTAQTITQTAASQSAPPADATVLPAVVALDEESLKAIEDRFARQLKALPGLLNGNQEQLRALWALWAEPDEPFGPDSLDKLVGRSKKVATFVQSVFDGFGHAERLTLEESKERLQDFLETLKRLREEYAPGAEGTPNTPDETVRLLGEKLSSDRTSLANLEVVRKAAQKTEAAMGILRAADEDVFGAAQRLAAEHGNILTLLDKYRDGVEGDQNALKPVQKLYARAGQLDNELKRIGEIATAGLGEESDGGAAPPSEAPQPAQAVERLVAKLAEAKRVAGKALDLKRERDEFEERAHAAEPEAAEGKNLAAKISDYLNFDISLAGEETGPTKFLLGTVDEEPQFYRQLRLRLSAALLALDEALDGGARQDVSKALHIEGIKEHLKRLVLSLQGINLDRLWEQGLSPGFHDRWLHQLFRADLLLKHYFADSGELYALRDAVSQACAVLDCAMRRSGLGFARVPLLEKPAPNAEKIKNALPELRGLPEVKQKVLERYHQLHDTGFVVDVQAFSLTHSGAEENVPVFFTMNRSDWD